MEVDEKGNPPVAWHLAVNIFACFVRKNVSYLTRLLISPTKLSKHRAPPGGKKKDVFQAFPHSERASTVISRGCCLSYFCNSLMGFALAVNYSDGARQLPKNCDIKAKRLGSSAPSELRFAPSLWDAERFSLSWLKQARITFLIREDDKRKIINFRRASLIFNKTYSVVPKYASVTHMTP